MKKLILLIIVSLVFVNINAQFFVTINPAQGHFNPGALVNIEFYKNIGVFGNAVYGNIKYFDGEFEINQFKYGVGLSYKTNSKFSALIGINRCIFSQEHNTNQIIDISRYKKTSLVIGIHTKIIMQRRYFYISMMTDPFNWESSIGVGVNINKKHRR